VLKHNAETQPPGNGLLNFSGGFMEYGERIKWTYKHFVNAKSSTLRTKRGSFEGLVRHTKTYNGLQMAIVRFDGNKRQSNVPMSELKSA